MSTYIWTTGSGRIEIQFMSLDQARSCAQPGIDASEDIEALRRDGGIELQLSKIPPDLLRAELKEYGAWDDDELADHEKNLNRILWVACGDVAENPRDYRG